MSVTISTTPAKTITITMRRLTLAGAAMLAIGVAAPTGAIAHDSNISLNGMSFDMDEDLLQQLIELDADDVAELRAEMAEAREEIADAVLEIEEARAEAREEAPGAAVIVNAALSAAGTVVSTTTNKAFKDVEKKLAAAERELADTRESVGEAEFAETTMAIRVIREEIAEIKIALSELTTAMKA